MNSPTPNIPYIPSFLEAKTKMEAWCAYQERCQFEVDQKLFTWKFNETERSQIIADLISNRFIDEERFARAFVSGKFRIKHWGRNKIKQHLKQKRISDYSIKKGLQEIDPDEYWNTLKRLAERLLRVRTGLLGCLGNVEALSQHGCKRGRNQTTRVT